MFHPSRPLFKLEREHTDLVFRAIDKIRLETKVLLSMFTYDTSNTTNSFPPRPRAKNTVRWRRGRSASAKCSNDGFRSLLRLLVSLSFGPFSWKWCVRGKFILFSFRRIISARLREGLRFRFLFLDDRLFRRLLSRLRLSLCFLTCPVGIGIVENVVEM